MRKFTLYQAARYSKISRYKLEQAIKEDLLKTINGKGNIKCFIYEEELKSFIDKYGEQYVRHEFNDDKKIYISPEINNFVSRDIHERMLAEKERIINILEAQNDKFLPLISDSDKAKYQINHRVSELETIANEALELLTEEHQREKERLQDRVKEIMQGLAQLELG
ncbi:MAG: hypothetical protein O3A01_03285 [bacterium]|nr:hypothetical protein [bacterium]